jgi:hypothetical protein
VVNFLRIAVTTLLLQSVLATMPAVSRDGQHDFDFEFGAWTAHLHRLVHPLSGSHTWVDYDGTNVDRKIWNGKANLGEFEVRNPTSSIQALSLRLYDPQTRLWHIYFANSKYGSIVDDVTGSFKAGRGEFYDDETYEGKPIRVRFIISDISRTFFRFEQSFSPDKGKTWELNWVATFRRVQ